MGTRITQFDFNKVINQFARSSRPFDDIDIVNIEFYNIVVAWFKAEYNGHLEYTSSYSSIYFQDEKDATLFLLKMSNESKI